jgi:hypothetical protein
MLEEYKVEPNNRVQPYNLTPSEWDNAFSILSAKLRVAIADEKREEEERLVRVVQADLREMQHEGISPFVIAHCRAMVPRIL